MGKGQNRPTGFPGSGVLVSTPTFLAKAFDLISIPQDAEDLAHFLLESKEK